MSRPKKTGMTTFTFHLDGEDAATWMRMRDVIAPNGNETMKALIRAWGENRLFILHDIGFASIVGEVYERMERHARRAGRREALAVLYEQGFIPEPHER